MDVRLPCGIVQHSNRLKVVGRLKPSNFSGMRPHGKEQSFGVNGGLPTGWT